MTDDIVTRLRNYDFMRDGDIPDVIMSVAADEIERLRNALEQCEAERDTWRTVAETEHIRFTNELKEVRGE